MHTEDKIGDKGMKYIIKNCPALFTSKGKTFLDCCNEPSKKTCKDITDCLLKRIVEKLKPLQIITFEHGIKGMFIAETKVELKQVSEILKLLEIEEVDEN